MKPTLTRLGLALGLAVALVLVLGVTLIQAPDAEAIKGTCNNLHRTQIRTGTSSVDCPWAEMDLHDQLAPLVFCDFGVCDETVIITEPCDPADYPFLTVKGFVEYRCLDDPL